MESQEKLLHDLVINRSVFFANRVDTYARTFGLDNQEVIDTLCLYAEVYGPQHVTAIIDKYMPPHLHSSQMPL